MDGSSSFRNILIVSCGLLVGVEAALASLALAINAVSAQTVGESKFLELQVKIPLGAVHGRIDHMAIDLARDRLFVAELGNDSVGVVDLKQRQVIQTIRSLGEPQGVGYAPSTDTLYVANARDGSVRLFHGGEYAPVGQIDLGSDADNVRLDVFTGRMLVGYGSGAIAFLDLSQQKKTGEIALPAHPESFQIGSDPNQVFVNLPDVQAVAVLDDAVGTQTAQWRIRERGNFAMALDRSARRVLIITRDPPKLIVLSERTGARLYEANTCRDSDDVFIDAKRNRIYVSCGAGFIDVFASEGDSYRHLARVSTIAGARTSLFIPELDLLLLGVRAARGEGAAIWMYRALP